MFNVVLSQAVDPEIIHSQFLFFICALLPFECLHFHRDTV